MKNFETYLKTAFAALGAVLGGFFGGFDGLFYALLAFVLADIVTGVCAAAVKKNLSSREGFTGALRKIVIFIVVGAANVLDGILPGGHAALRDGAIMFYIAAEGLSILENAALSGVPVPGKLKQALKILRENDNKEDENDEKNRN